MRPRHLLFLLPVFGLLSPAARGASTTPPDKQTVAPVGPAHVETLRPSEIKPTAEAQAYAVVEKQLVKPLSQREGRGSRFSRAYLPPQARRVRVDHAPSRDGRGGEFLTFAIDERSATIVHRAANDAAAWRTDAIVGCVYPARDEVFIKRGDKFLGAAFLLGRRSAAADEMVCRPALTQALPSASTVVSASRAAPGSGPTK